MKLFEIRELRQAVDYAVAGNQALHLHNIIVNPRQAPQCFVRAIENGEYIAHLFDMDEERLIKTARKLGVRVIKVERKGTPSQHIDLCGVPLVKAMTMCESPEEYRARWG
jgi:hypothetical protein